MENSLRFNEGKPKTSLVHYKSLEPLVRVLEFGADKYGAFNWKKPPETDTQHLESLSRHLFALMDGEEYDNESKMHHIGHIMANAMMYSYHMNNNKESDSTTVKEAITAPEVTRVLTRKDNED